VLQIRTILEFDPPHLIEKHEKQAEWKKTAICNVGDHDDICTYYAWFLKKRFNISLNPPMRGSHVTVINDKIYDLEKYNQAKEIFNKKEIIFEFDPAEVRGANNPKGEFYWWLKVYNTDVEAIREFAGLSRKPFFNLHLTLGAAKWFSEEAKDSNGKPLKDEKGNRIPVLRKKEEQIEQLHHEYIMRQILKFNL
jgi:hypothetical protein